MRPAFFHPKTQANITQANTKDRIARWIGFAALVALLAMATLPLNSGHRSVAVQNSVHWSDTWHG